MIGCVAITTPVCGERAPHSSTKFQGLRKDGSALWLEVMASLVDWEGGPATQATVVDITARKRAEAEREQLQAQLFEAQKMEAIGTLAGGIAHDFNNILGIMLGYTELTLMDVPHTSVVHTRLMKVLNAGKRARDLVRQILTFSRRSDQQRQSIHIPAIIDEALMLLRATLPATIDIRPHIETIAGTVLADLTQIHQVLMNLCTNAEHAMRETGGCWRYASTGWR
jgi:C4-dicarboxylate-specific signal transduction histidine kinase